MSGENLKVLIISNLYPSKKSPYYGSFVKNFETQLKEDRRIKKLRGIYIKGLHGGKLNKAWTYFIFYLRIFFVTLFERFDLIYIHLITHSTIPLRIVNFLKPLPLVFNIHGEDLLVTTSLTKKLLEISLPLVKKSKWIVVPSHYFKIITKEYLPDYPESKIIVSASGGIKPCFHPTTDNKYNYPNIKIGYVSRIDRGKGWRTLIESIKLLSERNFYPETYIVGGGPQESELRELISNYQLNNIHFLGPIAHDDLPSFYQSLDVFIFPTELRESLGLVGLEAMACGIPVIGSNIGGLTDYIKADYNGFFFSPGDSEDLSKTIYSFSQLEVKDREYLSNNAVKTAREYLDSIVAKTLFDTIL